MDDGYYRKRAEKRIIIAAVVIVAIGAGIWYFSHSPLPRQVSILENSAVKVAAQKIVSEISNPPPLVATGTPAGTAGPASYVLTRPGVITQTNVQRKENGNLSALSENAQLDSIATLRLEDMFAKQYFAHFSPSSSSAITVAKTVGYQYIALGENLALGNFPGDKGVVTAWMGSPGHRANILDTHYTEIGVAVREGIFNGEDTWIAVQIFGKPSSDCAAVDDSLKTTIEATQSQLSDVLANLDAQKANLQKMQAQGDPGYNQAASSYNALVGQYNALAAEEKQNIAQYNSEVNVYNQCVNN